MAKKPQKEKVVHVQAHPLHVPPSKKNPTGITTRRAHDQHIHSLGTDDIKKIFKNYDRKNIAYPTAGRLKQRNADQCDDLIAVWCDYYNKLFPPTPPDAPLEPNVVKALIASESDFRLDPPNPQAVGIAQITPATWKIIQNPSGELKGHLFKGILKRDLKSPEIAIPVATRWLIQKRNLARSKLKRGPTPEEIILEYKGLLKSKSDYKKSAVKRFREAYAELSKK